MLRQLRRAKDARLQNCARRQGFLVRQRLSGRAVCDSTAFLTLLSLQKGTALSAIEVKGGAESRQSGMAKFLERHPEARRIIVGGSAAGSCGLDEFLLGEVELFW